jgi:hypothetical protein
MEKSVQEWAQTLRQFKPEEMVKLIEAIQLVTKEQETPQTAPPPPPPQPTLSHTRIRTTPWKKRSKSFQEVRKKRRQKRKARPTPSARSPGSHPTRTTTRSPGSCLAEKNKNPPDHHQGCGEMDPDLGEDGQ